MSKNVKKIDILKSYIIEIDVLGLHEKEALQRLADKGFDISRAYYYKIQKQIKESRLDRLHLIAKDGLIDSHLQILDTLNFIQKEILANYKKEKDPTKRVLILEKLEQLQYSKSSYMDASQYIYEKSQLRKKKKLEQETIS